MQAQIQALLAAAGGARREKGQQDPTQDPIWRWLSQPSSVEKQGDGGDLSWPVGCTSKIEVKEEIQWKSRYSGY